MEEEANAALMKIKIKILKYKVHWSEEINGTAVLSLQEMNFNKDRVLINFNFSSLK